MSVELVVVLLAPVPVGHRVEITWYEEESRGLGGQVRTDARPHQPVITDLDTGVVYQSDWAFGHGGRSGADLPTEVEAAPLADFRVARRVVGTVRACRVVLVRATARLDVQTHLDIEVEAA